jgi:PEP-CTERM motif.
VPIYQTVGGLTATASGVGGNHAVAVFTPPLGLGFGNHSLTSGGTSTSLRLAFSYTALSVTVEFGDQNPDDDGTVTLAAYNAADVLVDIESLIYGTLSGTRSLTVDAPDIAYVITGATGSVSFPNSLAYDNVAVTPGPGFVPVPEPSTLSLFGPCLAMLALRGKRPRR